MVYTLLPQILLQEGGEFRATDKVWRKKDLIPEPYRRRMLNEVKQRYLMLEAAMGEFETLDRGPVFIKIIYQLRLHARKAGFSWRFDDMSFLQDISGFYLGFGKIMRLLAIEKARGRFTAPTTQGN